MDARARIAQMHVQICSSARAAKSNKEAGYDAHLKGQERCTKDRTSQALRVSQPRDQRCRAHPTSALQRAAQPCSARQTCNAAASRSAESSVQLYLPVHQCVDLHTSEHCHHCNAHSVDATMVARTLCAPNKRNHKHTQGGGWQQAWLRVVVAQTQCALSSAHPRAL